MKIIKLNNKNSGITYWKEEKTGNTAKNNDGSIKYDIIPGGEGILCNLVWSKKTIDGEYGLKSIKKGIKRVKIKYEEYKERKKREDKIRENDFKEYDWDYDNNPLYFHIVDAPERYGDEKLATIPYSWGDGEVYSADSYADITKIENNDGTQVEFYSTKEIIEILEKWIEMVERWEDPKERAKMIEEYEKENGIEKDKGIIDRIRGWIGKKDKGEN